MKFIDAAKIPITLAHNQVPRKALIKVGESKINLQTFNLVFLEPGRGLSPHSHSDSGEIYYFLTGKGEMTVNMKNIKVHKEICIIVEANESHGLKNIGKQNLQFLTIRFLQK